MYFYDILAWDRNYNPLQHVSVQQTSNCVYTYVLALAGFT